MESYFIHNKKKKESLMQVLIHPTYFPTIEFFYYYTKTDNLIFEINDFYKKQTVRNRTTIYGPNGKLNLIVPVKFSSKKKEKLKDIRICNDQKWQNNHLKSIQIAYRSSPYFEFFEDHFIKLFEKKEKFLLDINIKSIELIYEFLDLNFKYSFSKEYVHDYDSISDLRKLSEKKRNSSVFKTNPYMQVFFEKCGFIKNLSVIDLIFNEGINSLNVIKSS